MEDASEENQPESPIDENMDSDAGENQSEDEYNESNSRESKRPLAEEEEERKTKRKKTDGSDNNDGNSSGGGGGAGPSAPSGPSDSGPSDSGPSSSSDGGLLSKIWANFVLSLSSFFQTLAEIASNMDWNIILEAFKAMF